MYYCIGYLRLPVGAGTSWRRRGPPPPDVGLGKEEVGVEKEAEAEGDGATSGSKASMVHGVDDGAVADQQLCDLKVSV